MIKLCTFQQAVNCIERGGAAYRYGTEFPIWYKGGVLYEYYTDPYPKSANLGYFTSFEIREKTPFTLEDQQAVDWVLIPKKKWDEYQKKRKEDIEKLWIDIQKRYEPANSSNDTVVLSNSEYIEPKKPWWQWW